MVNNFPYSNLINLTEGCYTRSNLGKSATLLERASMKSDKCAPCVTINEGMLNNITCIYDNGTEQDNVTISYTVEYLVHFEVVKTEIVPVFVTRYGHRKRTKYTLNINTDIFVGRACRAKK